MPDIFKLSQLAFEVGLDFTGPIGHDKLVELARAWLPEIKFHESEMFHTIDLDEFYSVPAAVFFGLDPAEQQQFTIQVGSVAAVPPVITIGGGLRGQGNTVKEQLLLPNVDANAVYSHGGNLRAADKFFGSIETADGTLPRPGNPRLPRHPLRVRVEFRMLLETLKQDLVLAELNEQRGVEKPVDAIWGEFDVTDLLLLRPESGLLVPASRSLRHDFARRLIREHENGNNAAVEALLENPPPDAQFETTANRTVWTALKGCGLLEYHLMYAYNDFKRYGGRFTNEHEGDPDEGFCLVFERERLKRFQAEGGDPLSIPPMALITSVHNESNLDDRAQALPDDGEAARAKLEVFVALGSHATYLDADIHDFLSVSDLARESFDLFALAALADLSNFLVVLPLLMFYEHFNPDPDVTSDQGLTGKDEVNPAEANARPVEVVVTPLSRLSADSNLTDRNIYDVTRLGREPLALRAYRGKYGAHDGLKDKSPRWENKTRRYFEQLVRNLETGKFRQPAESAILL